MLGAPVTDLDLRSPRRIAQILTTALRLYVRMPLLFLFLAGIVVVPYEVASVLIQNGGKSGLTATEAVLVLIDLALINPFVAALQVQAVLDLGEGRRPVLSEVFRRGLSVLPVVAAAEIVVGLSEGIGLFLFVIPGLIVAVRWAVAAQVAAVERTDWPTALRRSLELTRGNFWRVLGLLAIVGILDNVTFAIIGSGQSTGATIAGIAVAIIVSSFGTLVTNLLYFDLRAREAGSVA